MKLHTDFQLIKGSVAVTSVPSIHHLHIVVRWSTVFVDREVTVNSEPYRVDKNGRNDSYL